MWKGVPRDACSARPGPAIRKYGCEWPGPPSFSMFRTNNKLSKCVDVARNFRSEVKMRGTTTICFLWEGTANSPLFTASNTRSQSFFFNNAVHCTERFDQFLPLNIDTTIHVHCVATCASTCARCSAAEDLPMAGNYLALINLQDILSSTKKTYTFTRFISITL